MPYPDSTYEQQWREARIMYDRQAPRRPYISLYHSRHGVDAAVLDCDDADFWSRECGYDPGNGSEYLEDAPLRQPYASAPEMLLCLRAALAAFQELDDDWRGMDATLVDQIIATNRYALAGCLLRAEGRE